MAVSGTSGSLQISGIASGLDTDAIIGSLLDIARIPLNEVDNREATQNNELTAWRALNTRILAFETSLTNLKSEELLIGREATTTDDTIAVATAGSGKDLGTYELTVESLATRHQTISQGYEDLTSSVGEGSITIQVGTAVFGDIDIGPENSTLEGIRDAINEADSGVGASILDAGESAGADRFRLVLNSNNTGTTAQMTVTFDLDNDPPVLSDLSVAKDAEVTVGSGVNAVTVTSSKNSIEDFLPGVTLDLLQADPGKSIELNLEADRSGARAQVENFVRNYNQLAGFFTEQFDYNETNKTTGVLFGDASLLGLQNDIVTAATGRRENSGDFNSLTSIGITLDEFGNLSITDEDALAAALEKPDDLQALLNDPDNGVVTELQKVMDNATTTTTGLISSKESVIQQNLIDLGDKRLNILRRVDKQELLLRQQFANMERTLSMLQSQSNQLAAQLGGVISNQAQ